jgi:hypothetical protein
VAVADVAIARAVRRNRRAARRVLVAGAALGMVVGVLAVLLVAGLVYGPVALATGLLAAVLPVPLYLLIALRVDRFATRSALGTASPAPGQPLARRRGRIRTPGARRAGGGGTAVNGPVTSPTDGRRRAPQDWRPG